jgi:Uma2 family endonuclease
MPATDDPVTTIDQLLALPDDGMRHELLDGVHVVTPAPSRVHQRAVGEFYLALRTAIAHHPHLEALSSPADLVLDPTSLVQPDLFIVERTPGNPDESWQNAGVPLVAIEILSRSTAARDRGAKRRIYQRAGVAQYWIVDLDARLVERWTPSEERPKICDATLAWELPGGASGEIDLPSLFQKVLGT